MKFYNYLKENREIMKNWNKIISQNKELSISLEILKKIKQFCRENNLNNGNMCYVAKGIYKHHKGWECKKL